MPVANPSRTSDTSKSCASILLSVFSGSMGSMTPGIVKAIARCMAIGSLIEIFALAESKLRTVSVGEGKELVYALLKPSGCTRRRCEVDRLPDKYFPQLFLFEGLWPNPTGSPHIGSWAVDPQTGDLWDANVCVEYRSSGVESLQRRLRKRIGLTEDGYKKLKQRPPMCDPGEKVEIRSTI
jgi:hypothetical protein